VTSPPALLALSLLLSAAPPPPPPARLDPGPLRAAIDEALARGALARARVGIAVVSLESGELLYGRDPDALLNPASNAKLLTTAAALLRLGPEYRFSTELWTPAPPDAAGAVKQLFVRGRGDPTWTTERLWALAADLQHRGLRSVAGDLWVDEGFFDEEREAPGYEQEQGDRAYLAPSGAVSLNFNAVAIHLAPGARPGERIRAALEPESDYLELVNRAVTGKAGSRGRVVPRSLAAGARQRITVEGRLPVGGRELAIWRKVDDPAAYFGQTLRRLLALRGVKVLGKVRRGPVPVGARLLHLAESEPLSEVVRKLNKVSQNFMAEQLLKTLGAEAGGPPGSWQKGVAAGEEALSELGLARGSYVWKNGSGLNDANRVSARQLATLLRSVWRRFPLAADFAGSLPVAGRDGTVRYRMEGTAAEGRLRAKTGTLSGEGVSSLSGYVEAGSGELLAFAILVNDLPPRTPGVARSVDGLAALLAEAGRPAAAPVAEAPLPPEDVPVRVATYYRLGLARDRRNLVFLRSALRSERDPAVRMAAGEAVYLSDPDSDAARRAFVEAVSPDAGALARLRELAAGPGLTAPVLGSLADLASEGLAEAVGRLLELGPALAGEPVARDAFAEALDEVARNAPEEVAAGLRQAPPPAAEVALRLLGPRLARDRDHPLLEGLRAQAQDPDESRAAPGQVLLRQLTGQASAEAAAPAGPGPAPAPAPPAVAPPAPGPAEPEVRPGGG